MSLNRMKLQVNTYCIDPQSNVPSESHILCSLQALILKLFASSSAFILATRLELYRLRLRQTGFVGGFVGGWVACLHGTGLYAMLISGTSSCITSHGEGKHDVYMTLIC